MRSKTALAMAVVFGLVATGTGCVMPDQLSRLEKDVAGISQQLRRIEQDQSNLQQQVASLENLPAQNPDAITRADLADVEFQFEQLARQVSVTHERMNDIDQRLDGFSLDLQQARRAAPVTPIPTTDVFPAGGSRPPTQQRRPAAGTAAPDPEALYNTAYADFSKGNYALAISGFQEYQERFPDSALADNALYWIAECHFSQGDFGNAVNALDRLLETYPRSDKAAAGNLKKALAFLEQNQLRLGIVQLQYVVEGYPGTDEARLARDKLTSLGSPQR